MPLKCGVRRTANCEGPSRELRGTCEELRGGLRGSFVACELTATFASHLAAARVHEVEDHVKNIGADFSRAARKSHEVSDMVQHALRFEPTNSAIRIAESEWLSAPAGGAIAC